MTVLNIFKIRKSILAILFDSEKQKEIPPNKKPTHFPLGAALQHRCSLSPIVEAVCTETRPVHLVAGLSAVTVTLTWFLAVHIVPERKSRKITWRLA